MNGFLLSKDVANICSYLGECTAILFFSNHLKCEYRHKTLGLALLFLSALSFLYFRFFGEAITAPDYSVNSLIRQFSRMTLHLFAVFGYILFSRKTPWKNALYWAAFFTVLYLNVQNTKNAAILPVQPLNIISPYRQLVSYGSIVLEWISVVLICHFIDPSSVKKTSKGQWSFAAVSLILEVYIKWSLITINVEQRLYERSYDLVWFAFLAGTGVLFILVLYETNLERQKKIAQAEAEALRMKFSMEHIKHSMQANNDIQRLYHDMKNHMLAMQGLADDSPALKRYLSDLLHQLQDYETLISTGNPTVDAILSQKIQQTSADHILFNIVLNLRDLSFMRESDLVTILGNAVDNAVEAVRKIPDPDKRLIYIKSSHFANMKVLRISNQFEDKIRKESEDLLTSKTDVLMHGIGVKSIKKAVEHYGGSTSIEYDNEKKWFRLLVMIPMAIDLRSE